MQLETDQHWYAFFGFFFTQQTDEAKLEIMQPWTREKVLVEMFDILKNGRDDRLKINLLIFLEENTTFFFSTHPTVFQGTCTLLNELLTLPTVPKVTGNPKEPSTLSYSPYTPNPVKTQVLITLTTILITSETIHRQPSTIESLVDILFEIITDVNESSDRLLRQTAAESLRELSLHFSGLLISRLGLLFQLARDERLHVKMSYTSLFSTALTSCLDCISTLAKESIAHALSGSTSASPPQFGNVSSKSTNLPRTSQLKDAALTHFEETLRNLGLTVQASSVRLLSISNNAEMPSFQLPQGNAVGKCYNYVIPAISPMHWLSLFRTDLAVAAALILEQIPSATMFESVRLTQHLVSILQLAFLSKDNLDWIEAHPETESGLTNVCQSLTVSTDLLIKPERLESILRWALLSNMPVLWTFGQIVLSRLPIRSIQPVLANLSEMDMIATTQPLNLILRDDLLLLSKTFSAFLNDKTRSLFLEWLVRRPVHSDAENCAYLLTTPPTLDITTINQTRKGSLQSAEIASGIHPSRTSFPPERAGSFKLAEKLASKRHLLFPTPFDSLLTIHTKLIAVAYCYASSGTEQRIPPSFLRTMSILSDFANSNSSSIVLFRVVTHYLLNFPSIFDPLMRFLENILETHPKFTDHVWGVITVLQKKNAVLTKAAVLHLCRFLALLAPPLLFNYVKLIVNLVKLKDSLVDVLLEAIRLNLRCSPQTREGNWQFGNSIIDIIQLTLLHHEIRSILTPSCNLLSLLATHFGDFEIRDRASFMLQLLTHVPADKIRNIIEVNAKTIAENLDVDHPFLNTESSKLSAAGFHPITFKSPGDPSSSPSSVASPPNVLILEKTSPHFNINSLAALENPHAPNNEKIETPVLDSYYDQLLQFRDKSVDTSSSNPSNMTEPATTGDSTQGHASTTSNEFSINNDDILRVQVPFLLRFKTPSEIRKDGGDLSNLPLSLYSLTLSLKGSTLYGNTVHKVTVPFLASRVKSAADLTNLLIQDLKGEDSSIQLHKLEGPRYGTTSKLLAHEGDCVFPYSFSFVLSMKVLLPLPTFLQVSATANTAEGAVAEIAMDPAFLSLKDLFVPLPTQFAGQHGYDDYLCHLFDEMWQCLSRGTCPIKQNAPSGNDHQDNSTNASGDMKDSVKGTSSVKYIPKPAEYAINAIHHHLEPFLVKSKSSPSSEAAFIFLPHKYHLLMMFEIGKASSIVRIHTDWWRILPHMDKFLDDIFR